VDELAELLALERKASAELNTDIGQLSAELQASLRARDDLNTAIRVLNERAEGAESRNRDFQRALTDALAAVETKDKVLDAQRLELDRLANDIAALRALKEEIERETAALAAKAEQTDSALIEERRISESARAQIALLNQQTAALREQIRQLTATLETAEEKARDQEVQIVNLGQRLNAALASKVQELKRYRSEFFGRLREALGDHPDIRIVGDRFVFQSEVLFGSGSAELEEEGRLQLLRVADVLKDVSDRIPEDIDWVLRVDGHTDTRPIDTILYPSNWELSTARAISVVRLLIERGIPPDRLVAAGFGEFHPLHDRDTEAAFRRNRRIELKLTQR
jgi:chemotaxis protein MotB